MSGTGGDLARYLMTRRDAPGMLDMAAIRSDRARLAAVGLGLAQSPLAAHLRARSVGGGGAVAGGELSLALGTLAEEFEAAIAEPATALAAARSVVRASGPVTATAAAVAEEADGPGEASVGVSAALPLVRARPAAIPTATATAALPAAAQVRPDGGMAGSDMASAAPASASWAAAGAIAAAPDASALPLIRQAGAALSGEAAWPLPLARGATASSAAGAAASAGPSAAAVPTPPDVVMPGAPPTSMAVGAMRGAEMPTVDRLARDLRRRLMVERERHGVDPWKS